MTKKITKKGKKGIGEIIAIAVVCAIFLAMGIALISFLGNRIGDTAKSNTVKVMANRCTYDGGVWSEERDRCEFQQAPPAEATLARCQSFALTFGKTGSFHGEYDSNLNSCVIGLWEDSRVKNTTGISLADLKIQGDEYTILMPFDGYVNHSAKEVYVDGVLCTPGNPVQCDGISLIKRGTPVKFLSEPNNDSSGPMLIEKP